MAQAIINTANIEELIDILDNQTLSTFENAKDTTKKMQTVLRLFQDLKLEKVAEMADSFDELKFTVENMQTLQEKVNRTTLNIIDKNNEYIKQIKKEYEKYQQKTVEELENETAKTFVKLTEQIEVHKEYEDRIKEVINEITDDFFEAKKQFNHLVIDLKEEMKTDVKILLDKNEKKLSISNKIFISSTIITLVAIAANIYYTYSLFH